MYVFLSKSNLSDFKILVVLLFKSLTCRYTKGYHFFYMFSTGCKMSKIWPGVFVNTVASTIRKSITVELRLAGLFLTGPYLDIWIAVKKLIS